MNNSRTNFIASILMWLLSYFYVSNTFRFDGGGFSITIFTVLLILLSIWYIKSTNNTIPRNSLYYLAFVMLIAFSFSIFQDTGKNFIKILVLLTSIGYWLLVATNSRTNDVLDQNIIKDLFTKILILPLSRIHLLLMSVTPKVSFKTNKTTNIFIGLLISFPFIILVSSLLSNTDSTFKGIFYSILNLEFLYNLNIFYIIISFIFASGLFAALYINSNKEYNFITNRAITMDNTIVKTVLISFIFIYIVYLMSVSYTYLNYKNILHTASQISSYAVSGFYELCAVSVINFIIFMTTRWLVVEEKRDIKVLLTIIGIQTLLMVIIGLLRLMVYIGIYGLTHLRFNAFIFMVLLFITVVIFIVGIYININYSKISILIGSAVFVFLCYMNVGNFIIKYNITLNKETIYTYYDRFTFGYEIIPFMIDRYNSTDDINEKNELKEEFNDLKDDIRQIKIENKNIELLHYESLLNEIE